MEHPLARLVHNYQPSPATTQVVRKTRIVLVAGPAGAGKDSLINLLREQGGFHYIVSHTTRKARENNGVMEEDGIDYHFIDEQVAEDMMRRREFVEVNFVHGKTLYGASAAELRKACDDGIMAITDLDVQGVEVYQRLSKNVRAIFIVPPDFERWLIRVRQRYSSDEEFEAEWPKRRESARQELATALSKPYYIFVVNDQLGDAAGLVQKIGHGRADNYDDAPARKIGVCLLAGL